MYSSTYSVVLIVITITSGTECELCSKVSRIPQKDKIRIHFKTMLPAVEYRSVIRFLLLRHYDNQSIISELSAAYGDEAPCRATVYSWIKEFQSGRLDVTDRKSTGRPIEIGDDHQDKLKRIVYEDR